MAIPGPTASEIIGGTSHSQACAREYLSYLQMSEALRILDEDHARTTAPLRTQVQLHHAAWQTCEMKV